MTAGSPGFDASALVRELLAHGRSARFAYLLERGVPVKVLRDLARRHGLTVKGFRIDRAPASKLAAVIADAEAELLNEAAECWVRSVGSAPDGPAESAAEEAGVSPAVLKHKEQELTAAQAKFERSEAQAARYRGQVDQLRRELQSEREKLALSAGEVRHLERALAAHDSNEPAPERDRAHRIHELERELEARGEAEQGLRRLLALRDTRLRDAESQLAELEALVPKGRRRKRPRPVESDPETRFRVPYISDSFYKSLVGKERLAVERALRAVFLYCSEGPAYPGLEVKQIEGQELWSLRASLKLRVYFRVRTDGDIEVVSLADREDQRTTLRRLKER